MPKLHQILAVEADIRNQTQKDLTTAHHGLQKVDMLKGQTRTYRPVDEAGAKLPPEGNLLQTRVPAVIKRTSEILTKMFDVVATRDFGNLDAVADVEIDGKVLLNQAPAVYLLWLEKKLVDLHTFVTKLPVLPADTEWEWDGAQNCYRARAVETHRTNKIEDFKMIVPATEQHPAQVAKIVKDEVVGYWTTINFSGAIKAEEVEAMKDRVERLQIAVKFAREKANQVEVSQQKPGAAILGYVFGV